MRYKLNKMTVYNMFDQDEETLKTFSSADAARQERDRMIAEDPKSSEKNTDGTYHIYFVFDTETNSVLDY